MILANLSYCRGTMGSEDGLIEKSQFTALKKSPNLMKIRLTQFHC